MNWYAIAVIGGVLNAVLLLVLGLWIIARKRARDERELRGQRESERLLQALSDGSDAEALARLFGPLQDETDLAVLDRALSQRFPSATNLSDADASTAERISVAADGSGLTTRLAGEATARDPVRRGLAVLLASHPGLRTDMEDVRRALADPDPDVRLAAAAACERMASPEAAWALVDAAATGALPGPRISERLGHAWATGVCVEALAGEGRATDAGAREAVLRALTLAADPEAVTVLLTQMDDPLPGIRVGAARALGSCAIAASPDDRHRALAALQAALRDPEAAVRCVAASSLGGLGDPGCVPDLEAVAGDRDWWVRANAAEALGRLGGAGMAALERIAEGPDRFAADRAREELARHGGGEAR